MAACAYFAGAASLTGVPSTLLFSPCLLASFKSMTILRPVGRSPQKGAETLVWLATSPDIANVTGAYFFDQEQRPPSPEAQDRETARRLWKISERQCAVSGRSAAARS